MTEGFKAAGDDYSHIMAEALADRLAEVRRARLLGCLLCCLMQGGWLGRLALLPAAWLARSAGLACHRLSGMSAARRPSLAPPLPPPPPQALAEKLHELVRREVWGYAADESMSVDDMLKVGRGGVGGWAVQAGGMPCR